VQAEAGWSNASVPGAWAQGATAYCSVGDGRSMTGLRRWGSGVFAVRLRKDAVRFGDALTRWASASCWWAGWE
jgi:hypothetical protein